MESQGRAMSRPAMYADVLQLSNGGRRMTLHTFAHHPPFDFQMEGSRAGSHGSRARHRQN